MLRCCLVVIISSLQLFVAAEIEQDSVYEVLFDEEFLGGLNIRSVSESNLVAELQLLIRCVYPTCQ